MSNPDGSYQCPKSNIGCTEDSPCELCCEHSDIEYDERCCLICGKDMTEDLASAAYDRYKDHMKYGD